MPSVVVRIDLTPDEFLRYYRGEVQNVLAVSEDGRTVRFPASLLRTFVTEDGVSGRFRLDFDELGRSLGAQRLPAIRTR